MAKTTRDFVGIARTDTAQSGADIVFAGNQAIPHFVFEDMPRHHHVGSAADFHPSRNVDSAGFQRSDFLDDRWRINDNAGGD